MTDTAEIEQLIARTALRDREAFGALYDATAAKLLAVTLRILKDRAAAEDTMQDAFVKIWNNADRYRVTGHSPLSWMLTIARNTAIDRYRARKRDDADIDDHADRLVAGGPSPEGAAVAAGEARRLKGCFDELPDDRAAALRGAYLDGQSYKDLSDRFDVPLNTMRTWLRRGLSSLRECMAR